MSPAFSDELFDIYESQYARDFDGRLIDVRPATQADLEKIFNVTIDGTAIPIPKAVPATDDQGNLILDTEKRLVPRLTTIYDAATARYTAPSSPERPVPQSRNPIPVLCHQSHVKPVGVCRVCSVLTSRDGKAGPRLVPACHHPVVDKMVVHTGASTEEVLFPGEQQQRPAGPYVRATVKVLLELLAVNCLRADQADEDRKYRNELLELALEFGVPVARQEGRLEPATPFTRPEDHLCRQAGPPVAARGRIPLFHHDDSGVIAFDQSQCILCDRCVRACSEVKPFKIIGHTGFGHAARISFDLGRPMAESGCVSCGECAVSCPTGALTFKQTIYQDRDPWKDMTRNKPTTVQANELAQLPLFAGVPYAFLKWNEGAVGRLWCPPGHVLCRQKDYGATAFVIEDGELEVIVGDPGKVVGTRTVEHVIVGEMACMTHQPRTATLRAAAQGATVLVVRRNMLHMLQRNRNARLILYPAYRNHSLQNYLQQGQLFAGLSAEESQRCVAFLQGLTGGVEFSQADPGQVIFRQGNEADSFYVVNLGHVAVSETNAYGQELVRDYLGPGRHFGEIGLMSALFPDIAALLREAERGRRTGTCTALDHVELVVIGREAFAELLAREPDIRDRLKETCRALIEKNRQTRKEVGHQLGGFTGAGLHQGQSLLVLDLFKCTRCQECVKACADSHGGVSRLILEGNRSGAFLVPSACRSCHDPLCLVGCPVDAIHRRPTANPCRPSQPALAIVIEDHCIGCGLCAHNCPFGSIHMHERPAGEVTAGRRVASNCDLCESLDGNPRCVHHCPHEAASRPSGYQFALTLGLHPVGSAGDTRGRP